MIKELTPLEVYKRIILCSIYDYDEIKEDTKIVESELRRLEEHDRIFKKYDIKDIWLEPALYVIKNHFPMDTETQLMKLTALDIIKEKEVNVITFKKWCICKEWSYSDYLNDTMDKNTDEHYFSKIILTEKEFDLLKETLK